ncbi:hypothetical protein TrVE_jg7780 [Triparma verrucosa]|uniref:CSC1/OSCA1-like cytosolic domain-containing protein n=1 Tax=Triparma verrucosa TaxID=1606542 RepID=A0A9W7BVB2_9STRA|nr:hypothetical protein TrVE_jg7780 [Triparma verrucosa]
MFGFGDGKSKDEELDEFLGEADKVLTPDTLRVRAKSGCEYSAYLKNPSAHHGQVLLKGLPGKEKPKALPFGPDGQPVTKPLTAKEVRAKEIEAKKTSVPNPTAGEPAFTKVKKKDNLMKSDLNQKQIQMEKRLSNPSSAAMMQLWKLGDTLDTLQTEVLALRDVPNNPVKLIKAKQDLAVLNGRIDNLQFEGIDAVVTQELESGRTEARDERKRLTKLAEETHELIHVMSLELKKRLETAGPDVKLSWKYFQGVTLPNRVVKAGTKNEFRKLEPGEVAEGSEPYGVFDTPLNELGDFGIGVLLYFKMLLFLGCLCVVLGLIGAYNLHYFDSKEYSSNRQNTLASFTILRGSAICDDYTTVCTDTTGCTCTTDTSSTPWAVSGDGCALKKNCEFSAANAYVLLAVSFVFLIGNFIMGWSHDKIVVEADEAEQTAQDYSIMVNDPDANATDPDEWQKFFSQFGHVSYVTVALNNGTLLSLLAKRKAIMRQLGFETTAKKTEDQQIDFDAEENTRLYNLLPFHKKSARGIVQLRHQLLTVDAAIEKEAIDKNFTAARVFVVFENEKSQRRCLQRLTTGTIPAALEWVGELPPHMIFRGTNVLSVCEAPEPTDVIWENLETPLKHQIIEQTMTLILSLGIVALCAYIIYLLNEAGQSFLAAFFISITNSVMPSVLKMINETEEHLTQGSKQTSLLLKLVFLRWMTTGFIVLLIRDTDGTLDEKFVGKVWAVLLADAITTPTLRLLDPSARIGRNYLSKKAESQEKMNSYFLGTDWFLAERYTDMTKTLFVSLFFTAIFPQGLFVTAFAFMVSYWVDKYCLFRLWKQPPAMDGKLADAARFQISLIFIANCFVSQHFLRGWPFDDLQATSSTATVTFDGASAANTVIYKVVDQVSYNFFDWTEQGWFSEDQKAVVKIYSILNIVALTVFAVFYFGHSAQYSLHKLFKGSYAAVGEAKDDDYSFVPGIQTYVPMVSHKSLGLPLIASDMKGTFDAEHISFTMKDYSKVDLTKSNAFRNVSNTRRKGAFSICKQYKSPRLLDWEIENVEVDMETIHKWERETMLKTKKVMKGGLEDVGKMGTVGGVKIGGIKSLAEREQADSKKKGMLGGPENHEL